MAVERRSKFKESRLLWAVLLKHGQGRGQLWRTPTHPTREEAESIQEAPLFRELKIVKSLLVVDYYFAF